MANKWVYMFSEGDMTMRNLLGGKGANLAEMTSILGADVIPQGFTVTTEACTQYYEDGRKINDEIMAQIMDGVKKMEEINGKKFGDAQNPLLVSVRSGARASMPGMMETILNLGLNDQTVEAMIKLTNNPRFCYDSYRRFLTMFGSVAWEMDRQKYFESELEKVKEREGVKQDTEISAEGLKSLIPVYKNIIKEENIESDVCNNTQNSVQEIENNILEGIEQEDIEFYETMIEDVLPSNSELAQKAHDELVKLIDYSCEKDYDMALEKWLKTKVY